MSLWIAGFTLAIGTINIFIGLREIGEYFNQHERQIYIKCHLIRTNPKEPIKEDLPFIEEKSFQSQN